LQQFLEQDWLNDDTLSAVISSFDSEQALKHSSGKIMTNSEISILLSLLLKKLKCTSINSEAVH
jgi:hypothetical protein